MATETENPKLRGSNLIDAIPQVGECPLRCDECFYNGGRFYRPLNSPLLPSPEEAKGKIVRVNSGHDSNVQRNLVLTSTASYPDKFFNTSIPRFDFPAPVVFTCNSHRLILVDKPPANLMFVRCRVSTANLEEADQVVQHYWVRYSIPVVMTFMRYFNEAVVPDKNSYEYRQHILNSYWMIKTAVLITIMSRWQKSAPPIHGIRMCGTPYSDYCADCRNCEFLCWDCLRRMRIKS